MTIVSDTGEGSGLRTVLRHAAHAAAIGMSLFHIHAGIFGEAPALSYRPIHLALAFAVLLLTAASMRAPETGAKRWVGLAWDTAMLVVVLVSTLFLVFDQTRISERMEYMTRLLTAERVLGALLLLVVLDVVRRSIGWPMVVITLVFLVYTQIGDSLPYPFWHRGYSIDRVIEQMYLTVDGIWTVPLAVTASYIFLFVLFGSLLVASGAGEFFTDLARALTGRIVGGPAKTAVVSSAFFSMLSGSSTANVVTTGSFTIPAMKRGGFSGSFAGGVEAVASTGGQIMPPIMGAAAFIMMETLGVPYGDIMIAAILPAIFYFATVFVMVDLEARRLNLRPAQDEEMPKVWPVLRSRGYLLVPVIFMVWALVSGYTPARAGVWAIGMLAAMIVIFDRRKGVRGLARIFAEALINAPKLIAPITAACAVGGIIVGVVSMTGLGYRMATIIIETSHGILPLALALTMVVAVIMGMGMPTSAVYVVLAVILAPAFVDFGVVPIAVHMFIFYYAVISNITPPLAVASFAAAAVGNADPWRTSLHAVRLGLPVFAIPYVFIYHPEFLAQGTIGEIAYVCVLMAIAILAISVASIGWLKVPLSGATRAAALLFALLLLPSEHVGLLYQIAILAGSLALFWLCFTLDLRRKAGAATAGSASPQGRDPAS